MKRIALIILSLSLLCQAAAAQQTWFCSEAGTRLTYVQKDAAGALQNGTMQYAVRDVQKSGSVTRIGYDVIVTDVAGASKTFTGSCAQTDGKSFTQDAGAFMGQFGSGLDVKGGAPAIPETPSVGAGAEDCSIVIDALMADARYSNIRFTRHEQVTTLAGTFDCWCLEYDVKGTVAFISIDTKVEQWMAKGVGDVKVVTKSKNGKVQNIKELVNIVK